MENIKIWHSPQDKPDDNIDCTIVKRKSYITYYILNIYKNPRENSTEYPFEFVEDYDTDGILLDFEWAYYDDWKKYIDYLIATSKALDVAIDALKSIKDMGNELEDPKVAIKALQTISEIKKGNK